MATTMQVPTDTEEPKEAPETTENPPRTERRFPKSVAVLLASLAIAGGIVALLETYASTSEAHAARETTQTAVNAMAASVESTTLTQLAGELTDQTLAVRADDELTALRHETEYLKLKQAALTETRIGWNNRASQLGTVLTVLAVAVFLTGFTLVVHQRIRIPILIPGVGLGIVCLIWASSIYLKGVPETRDQAVTDTATGIVKLEAGQIGPAETAFGTAIEADPDYGPAFEGRAVARFLTVNPDFLTTGAIISADDPTIALARADLEHAVTLAGDNDLYAPTLLGVLELFTTEPESAIPSINAAIAINDEVPELWFVAVAAHVAAGDADAADTAFAAGLALLDDSEPSVRTRALAAELLTELEWVKAVNPQRAELAQHYAEQAVAIEASFAVGRPLQPDRASAEVFEVAVFQHTLNDELVVVLDHADLDAETALSGLIFEQSVPGGAWAHATEMALVTTVAGSGTIAESVPIMRACSPTAFRLDLYVEGVLVTQTTTPGSTTDTCSR